MFWSTQTKWAKPLQEVSAYTFDLCSNAYLNAARCKLDSNGALGLQAELVPRETTQQVTLADSGVPDEDHFEQVVIAAASPFTLKSIALVVSPKLSKV